MPATLCSPPLREDELAPWADLLAFHLRAGDAVVLKGDLGAGKTALARAIIRATIGDDRVEVPSPTFSLVQTYEAPRVTVTHFDFYRLGNRQETSELGFEDAFSRGAVLIEWAERAPELLPPDRLEIEPIVANGGAARRLAFSGYGRWEPRLERLAAMRMLLQTADWGGSRLRHLQGDASTRRYARLTQADGRSLLLMDAPRQPDGPPVRGGKPYSRIAHLAEDVRPYVAIARALAGAGLSVPEIRSADLDAGLLLIEDLGDGVFASEVARGAVQHELWQMAVEALVVVHRAGIGKSLAVGDGSFYKLPNYDAHALGIETELLLDWYWPALYGEPAAAQIRADFTGAWSTVFEWLSQQPQALVLRDYHSPNLIRIGGRSGVGRVGIIDFQDAVLGHRAYDVVSLLQDARVDVPAELEEALYKEYVTAVSLESGFNGKDFACAYRALGAQRGTKILGIFARLARRDGKPAYLQHIPRIWGYLERNLAVGPLAPLRAWYDRHLPADVRGRPLPVTASPMYGETK